MATATRVVTINAPQAYPTMDYGLVTLDTQSPIRNPQNFSSDFLLCNDISLGAEFSVIGNSTIYFNGGFEGQFKKIKQGTIHSASDSVGIFSGLAKDAEVRHLLLEDIRIQASEFSNIGILAGVNLGRIYQVGILDAASTATGGEVVGGLVGLNKSSGDGAGRIEECFSMADVSGSKNVGGLVGQNEGKVIRSFSQGEVSSLNAALQSNFGGLIGWNRDTEGVDVHHSYALGLRLSLVSATNVGGLIGRGDSKVVTESYWNLDLSGIASSGGSNFQSKYGSGLSDFQMRDSFNFNLNFLQWSLPPEGGDFWTYRSSVSPYPIHQWYANLTGSP